MTTKQTKLNKPAILKAIDKWAKNRTVKNLKSYSSHLGIKTGWDEIRWMIALANAEGLDQHEIAELFFLQTNNLDEIPPEEAVNMLLEMQNLDDPIYPETTEAAIKFLIEYLEDNAY